MKYAFLFLCFSCGIFAQDAGIEKSLTSLIEAEKSFAAYSVQHGINQAFIKFLSDESVLFHPYPTSGKKLYSGAEEDSSYLFWTPTYAEISSSGDMGFTYGPWILKIKRDQPDSLAFYGFFLTVWKKENDSFKVVVDAGTDSGSQADFDKPVTRKYSISDNAKPNPSLSLQDADNELLKGAKESGYNTALAKYADNETVIFRKGTKPHSYKVESGSPEDPKCEWTVVKSETSKNRDLGYTLGQGKFLDSGQEFSFYRIWRKGESGWKIAVENIRPIIKK